jgi:hypothetical protein
MRIFVEKKMSRMRLKMTCPKTAAFSFSRKMGGKFELDMSGQAVSVVEECFNASHDGLACSYDGQRAVKLNNFLTNMNIFI